MKKIALYVTLGVLALFTSCELDEGEASCQSCYLQTKDGQGNVTYKGNPEEKCGAELSSFKDQADETDPDGNVTQAVCE